MEDRKMQQIFMEVHLLNEATQTENMKIEVDVGNIKTEPSSDGVKPVVKQEIDQNSGVVVDTDISDKNASIIFSQSSGKSLHLKELDIERPCESIPTAKSEQSEIIKPNSTQDNHKCDVCKESFKIEADLIKHLQIHSSKKLYSCNECDRSFTRIYFLVIHKQRGHFQEKPFSCNECDKSFATSNDLKRHTNIHLDVKPYLCEMCNKSFTQLNNLKLHHKNYHLKVKPFTCEICSKSFTQLYNLNRHKDVHLEVKPYSCNICQKSFTYLTSFKLHENSHLNLKPFTCEICNKSFAQLHNLKRHSNGHLKVKPYSCNVCSKSFTQLNNLKLHKNSHIDFKTDFIK